MIKKKRYLLLAILKDVKECSEAIVRAKECYESRDADVAGWTEPTAKPSYSLC